MAARRSSRGLFYWTPNDPATRRRKKTLPPWDGTIHDLSKYRLSQKELHAYFPIRDFYSPNPKKLKRQSRKSKHTSSGGLRDNEEAKSTKACNVATIDRDNVKKMDVLEGNNGSVLGDRNTALEGKVAQVAPTTYTSGKENQTRANRSGDESKGTSDGNDDEILPDSGGDEHKEHGAQIDPKDTFKRWVEDRQRRRESTLIKAHPIVTRNPHLTGSLTDSLPSAIIHQHGSPLEVRPSPAPFQADRVNGIIAENSGSSPGGSASEENGDLKGAIARLASHPIEKSQGVSAPTVSKGTEGNDYKGEEGNYKGSDAVLTEMPPEDIAHRLEIAGRMTALGRRRGSDVPGMEMVEEEAPEVTETMQALSRLEQVLGRRPPQGCRHQSTSLVGVLDAVTLHISEMGRKMAEEDDFRNVVMKLLDTSNQQLQIINKQMKCVENENLELRSQVEALRDRQEELTEQLRTLRQQQQRPKGESGREGGGGRDYRSENKQQQPLVQGSPPLTGGSGQVGAGDRRQYNLSTKFGESLALAVGGDGGERNRRPFSAFPLNHGVRTAGQALMAKNGIKGYISRNQQSEQLTPEAAPSRTTSRTAITGSSRRRLAWLPPPENS
eukprot:jgi/Bigna1/78270/fgenesh1_pg.53_\